MISERKREIKRRRQRREKALKAKRRATAQSRTKLR